MLYLLATALLFQGVASTPAAYLAAPSPPAYTPSRSIGKLPALGWNTWNAYRCDINETKVIAAANSFVSLGLKDAGYQYVNIDDCWSVKNTRDNRGRIVPDPNKFPNGISGVASKVHALGLKIGIYSDAGTMTCAQYPASLGWEVTDAKTFSDWGIDYLKYDNCNVPSNWSDTSSPPDGDWYNSNSAIRYRQMGLELSKLSRPIEYSLCIWGSASVWDWGARVGHSWRIYSDSNPSWSYITRVMNVNIPHLDKVDFYSHNDMDMMEIGNQGLTTAEERTHFAVWCFMKSPILLGTNLDGLSQTQVQIITNRELLAYHQDITVGTPAKPFKATNNAPTTSPPEYYSGKSSKGTHVLIVNTGGSTATKTFALTNVPGLGSGNFKIHDMWTGKDLDGVYSSSSSFSASVASHDSGAYLLIPTASSPVITTSNPPIGTGDDNGILLM
uniref:Alpha-galactosidase n=1 Tax=Moniliophthora roreri TaxID=221103 RepID=A0A0W0F0D3_MONRR